MKLLIDAGNTRIKWALVAAGDDWLRTGVLPIEEASELPALFADSSDIRQIWVSNVAGQDVSHHVREIGSRRSAQVHFVAARESQCGVRNGYSNASQLGSDRWAALIAAWRLVQRECLVVNCGTAITIDTLSAQGEFPGGLILPGIDLMRRSLATATHQLKSGYLNSGQGEYVQFPKNTIDAMYSGAIQAACGAIQRQHALLEKDDAPVILSGGAAEVLRGKLNLPVRVVDNLVLQGLLLISKETNA